MSLAAFSGPIAIDGPAASGKSSVGRALARALGFAFLDTGLMYRAFTHAALRAGVPPTDSPACEALAGAIRLGVEAGEDTRITLDGADVTARLRDPDVERAVSAYSAIPGVREAMVRQQRVIAAAGRAILAGRDIGTVVLPEAPVKLFLTASEGERARRRSGQSGDWGRAQPPAASRADIANRDQIDSSRAASPLRPAPDATVVDTSEMSLEAVVAFALEQVRCAAA